MIIGDLFSRRALSSSRWTLSFLLAAVLSLQTSNIRAESRPDSLLETADTSSPRSTLNGFIQVMLDRAEAFVGKNGFVETYLRSNALFTTPATFSNGWRTMKRDRAVSAKYLDLSDIPAAILDQSTWRLTLQLMEILGRIPIPDAINVPDAKAMEDLSYKKWTLPGSEIRIGLVESGPRAGEYLFTKETVAQIPVFFDRIRSEPYREGIPQHVYDKVFERPTGLAIYLSFTIPPRWFLNAPDWLCQTILGEPLWRWAALLVVFVLTAWLVWSSSHIARRYSSTQGALSILLSLTPALTLMLVAPSLNFILGEVLRITPHFYAHMTLTLWGIFYLSLTWIVWGLGEVIGEWVIGLERIQSDSTDSQLVKLTTRLIAMGFCIGILIEGANRIGLPSYSIIAGLGVGGLAFALAGQQALGNLLGSLIIMFEKPFRIGHSIKTGSIEGKVETIGFRTAKLRTSDGVLLIAPSSELIRHPIENQSLRDSWHIKKTLHFSLGSTVDRIQAFKQEAEAILINDPDVLGMSQRVALTGISPQGYEVLIDFVLGTSEYDRQLMAMDRIFFALGLLAEKLELSFSRAADV